MPGGSTVVLWRVRGSPTSRWLGAMRCCVRIWTSGSAACCSARRRRSWAGAGSRRLLWRPGCTRTRWPRGCGNSRAAPSPSGGCGQPGGGRKPATETDPGLGPALRALVDPQTRGDPESPLVWTTKSTRNLADALAGGGHRVSDRTVARMLRAQGFSLQANAKVTEGRQHVDRDAQFGYLNAAVVEHLAVGAPVVSVDTKKKELVGEFHNGGREYQPQGFTGARQRARLPGQGAGQGDPVRHLRRRREHRLGVGRRRPRHLSVRRGDVAPLVGHRGPAPLPARRPVADLRRRWRLQRLPGPRLEDRTRPLRRRDRPDDHRLPPATGHQQMEQDRTPAVLPDHPELAGPAR